MHNYNLKNKETPIIEFQKIDNLIPESFINLLEIELMNMSSWLYVDSASGRSNSFDQEDNNIVDSFQFSHIIYDFEHGVSSHLWDQIKPMLWFLEEKTGYKVHDIYRIKANLLLPCNTEKNNYNIPHTDHDLKDYTSMVYYVNHSDGDTKIFNEHIDSGPYNLTLSKNNSPQKGSAILFPSTQYHSSSNPIQSKTRFVINFVLKLSKS